MPIKPDGLNEELNKELTKLIQTLHPLERAILPVLRDEITLKEIIKLSGLKEVEAMRALQWLENKDILRIKQDSSIMIALDENGKRYLQSKLPERRLLDFLAEKKKAAIEEIKNKTGLVQDELSACIGVLKGLGALITAGVEIKITEYGIAMQKNQLPEEAVLKMLPLLQSKLTNEQKGIYSRIKKRKKLVKEELIKERTVELTSQGVKLLALSSQIKTGFKNIIDTITPDLIRNESWKGKQFRRFDIKVNVPQITAGKKQHYRRFLDEIRARFLALGFAEMTGPLVETEFWNMDALFMPQFHSARDIHDVYYIKDPRFTKELPKRLLEKIKASHEKSWQYKFDEKKSSRLILRSQGTACSARMLGSPNLKIPGKYFGITRCFRHDVIDATHNCDFYQTEGIVLEENLNFSHLKGLLKMFAEEFAGTTTIKIKPGYFPFTEPSAELLAKHPDLGWIELGGSGIFRPEMTKSFGIDAPVIAWGLGIDRIGMFNMNLKDIRYLFTHDLEILRSVKTV